MCFPILTPQDTAHLPVQIFKGMTIHILQNLADYEESPQMGMEGRRKCAMNVINTGDYSHLIFI
jgi:hypothetical protein